MTLLLERSPAKGQSLRSRFSLEMPFHHEQGHHITTGLVKSPDLIKRLLMPLAHQGGFEVSAHELATQLQLARQTVERYLELPEQTWVIFRLPSISNNPRKEISKSRKIYLLDAGSGGKGGARLDGHSMQCMGSTRRCLMPEFPSSLPMLFVRKN